MTNEIKEILEALKPHNDIVKEYPLTLSIEEQKILLDYITNLQEEIKEWEYIQDIQDKREYRKRYLEERRKEDPTLLYPDYDEIYKKYYEQKQRIDKAVEYINKYEYQKYCPSPYEKDKYIMREEKEGQDLLNILRGDE